MTRQALILELFPKGLPRLWCPTITHFSAPGEVDGMRTRRHLSTLKDRVRGLLVPGSTGEGWDMSDEDILAVLDACLDSAAENGQSVLVGVLKTTADEVLATMERTASYLMGRTGATKAAAALRAAGVVGFTVCPPAGESLSQDSIRRDLARVLAAGYPTALYQLPQVTHNEMSPETVAGLAEEFPNFFLFKDTSGRDAVAESGVNLGGVFMVRGAEGSYSRWPKAAGGSYDGFLLSTANAFAPELERVLLLLDKGDRREADGLSSALEGAVGELFELAAGFPAGNAFASANKLVDHLRAWGPAAGHRPMPMLYGGTRLPEAWVAKAADILERHGLPLREAYLGR